MTDDRWRRIEDVFHRATELAPSERSAFLDRICAGDGELRHEVESLLTADANHEPFLEASVARAAELRPAEPDEGTDLVGTTVGRYTITGVIGKGGMGTVYGAQRDDEFRMQVALKLLKRGTDTEAALRRFRTERQILAGLQHPNIARLLDGGATESGLPYFVMEYVEGKVILEHATQLSIRQRLELFRSVCAAVQYAHQNLVVHRDLKPSNVLVTNDGVVKLLDFGIAKLLDPATEGSLMVLTMTGAHLMTPDYASPEQVRGEPVTTATDIYSLGAVLYELLTSQRAHRIETYSAGAIERAVCLEEPNRPSAVAPQLDRDLDNIVLMALSKEPQRRYVSAEQFSEDIRRYLEGRPVRARQVTLLYRAGKFIRRNKLGVAAAALVLASAATGVVEVNRQARRAEYRFRQVRSLANTVLFDLSREIENLSGSTRARELLIRTSLEYLDSLAAEAGDDPALLLELATAYSKVGDVQGNPTYSNLGHPEAALASYGKSLSVAQKLAPSASSLAILVRNYGSIGSVYENSIGNHSKAQDNMLIGVRIADSIPVKTGVPAHKVRAEAYGRLGMLNRYRDPAAAIEPLLRGLGIAREWSIVQPGTESQVYQTVTLDRLGEVFQGIGDLPKARDYFQDALGVLEQLLHQQPGHSDWRRQQFVYFERLGLVSGNPVYPNLGDRKAAAVWAQKCLDGMERRLSADSADARARVDVGQASADLAGAIRESDPTRAEQLYRRAHAINTALLNSSPQNRDATYRVALNRVEFAWVLRKLGKRGEALGELKKAVEELEHLVQRDATDDGYRQDLGVALHTLAVHRLDIGEPAAAERDLQRSRSLLEPLSQANPRKLALLRDLADCYQGFGDLYARRLDWHQAVRWYQKNLDLWERWKQVGASSVYDRQRRDAAARLVEQAAAKSSKKFTAR